MSMTVERAKSLNPKRIRRIWRGTLIGILIGIVSGLGAIVFDFLLRSGTRLFTHDLVGFVPVPPRSFSASLWVVG